MESFSLSTQPTSEETLVMVIVIFCFICVEALCIFTTIYSLKHQGGSSDISLIVFYLSLHFTIILRILEQLNEAFYQPSFFIYWAIFNLPMIANDTMIGCLAVRYFEAILVLSSEEDAASNTKIPLLIKWTYIGLVIHFILFFIFLLLECSNIVSEGYILDTYGLLIQFILMCEFIYAGIIFSLARSKMDEESRKSVIAVWLQGILNYMIFVVTYRMIEFFLIFLGIFEGIEKNYPAIYMANIVAFYMLTELVPCAFLSLFLYRVSNEMVSEEESPIINQ